MLLLPSRALDSVGTPARHAGSTGCASAFSTGCHSLTFSVLKVVCGWYNLGIVCFLRFSILFFFFSLLLVDHSLTSDVPSVSSFLLLQGKTNGVGVGVSI